MSASALLLLCMVATPGVLCAQRDAEWTKADSGLFVGQTRLALRVYAWRDFMPLRDDSDGSDLMVNLTIADSGAALPPGLLVDSAWVRSVAGLWATAPTSETRLNLRNELDLMLRGGPKWAIGQGIEVLVKLRLPSGKVGYLVARTGINETS